jgi:hypothetical protein
MSEYVGASTSCNPKDFHSLYRENFTFTNVRLYVSTEQVPEILHIKKMECQGQDFNILVSTGKKEKMLDNMFQK